MWSQTQYICKVTCSDTWAPPQNEGANSLFIPYTGTLHRPDEELFCFALFLFKKVFVLVTWYDLIVLSLATFYTR